MKWKHLKYLVLPIFIVALNSCDMLTENPESFISPENFYQTEEEARAAVLSTYSPLANNNHIRVQLWAAMDAGSDMSRVGPLEPNPNTRVTGTMTWDAGSPFVTNPWARFHQTITRANLAIDRIPDVEMNADRQAALIGEAKFMRALAYFYLVRLYGGVPLVTSPSDPVEGLARAPEEEVYEQIIQDAQKAAISLPLSWDASNAGRATRGAALTVLADLHLYRGDWQQAADFAKQVIDLGVYSLFPDYLYAFLPDYENGQEDIFSLQADGPATPEVASVFAGIYFPRQVGARRGGGWGMVQPTQWHYGSYITGDYRKDVSYATTWARLDGTVFEDLYPHVFKFRPTDVSDHRYGDVNYPIYRYAEVLLIYAEALNELGRTGEAVPYLNRIRARARNADGNPRAQPADYSGPVSQNAVREAIFDERRWELAHEDKRWFDLKRRGAEYFTSQITAHDPQATGVEQTDMLWPIPQSEIDNSSLTQNPGY